MGIPFKLLDQRAGEGVITLPYTYHQGLSAGYTVAEAVNYADQEWAPADYDACAGTCPSYPITGEHMTLLGPGETQQEEEEEEEEEEEVDGLLTQSKLLRQIRQAKSAPKGSRSVPGNPDDSPTDNTEASPSAYFLPQQQADAEEELVQLVQFASEHVPPGWFDFPDRKSMHRRIQQFLPRGKLDRNVFFMLLQVVCNPARLFGHDDVDKLPQPSKEGFQGLVIPIVVSSNDAAVSPVDDNFRTLDKNIDWGVVSCNWIVGTFFSRGLEMSQSEEYFRIAIKFSGRDPVANPYQKESVASPAAVGEKCSGIIPCSALEEYIFHERRSETPVQRRARYLRMLLAKWSSHSQLSTITGVQDRLARPHLTNKQKI